MAELDELRTELRGELRELRHLCVGTLIAIGGEKSVRSRTLDAAIYERHERQRRGTPLEDIGLRPSTRDELQFHGPLGLGVLTVEELAALPREQVAGRKGLGRKTMQKLDEAVAERGLSWADQVQEAVA